MNSPNRRFLRLANATVALALSLSLAGLTATQADPAANAVALSRSATIAFSAAGATTAYYALTQSGATPNLSLAQAAGTFSVGCWADHLHGRVNQLRY